MLDRVQLGVRDTATAEGKFRGGIEDGVNIEWGVTGALEGHVQVFAAIQQPGINSIDNGGQFGWSGDSV